MTKHRIRHLPVLDRGQLAGIVSILDIVKAQLHKYEGEIERLHNSV
jgi:CBS domain-containing protein